MFAITLNEENYIETCSDRFKTPESILVEDIPTATMEELTCYKYIDGEFVFDEIKWAKIEAERIAAEQIEATIYEIANLKEMLYASDYQIIKCYEYALNNLELPYDVAELHAERQALRDQINALESTLNTKE